MAETSYPKGHKHNPLSDNEVNEKFSNLASAVLSDQQCTQALERLWVIEQASDLTGLFEVLVV